MFLHNESLHCRHGLFKTQHVGVPSRCWLGQTEIEPQDRRLGDPNMPRNDRPVKLDMSFEEAIRFFANARPKEGKVEPTHGGSQAVESCSTTEAAPASAPSDSQIADRQ